MFLAWQGERTGCIDTNSIGAKKVTRSGKTAATVACGRYACPWSTFDGRISNAQLNDRFEQNIVAFMDLVEAAKHYPCAKKAWFEFLGERPDEATARVE
jgi:hypothetical protein